MKNTMTEPKSWKESYNQLPQKSLWTFCMVPEWPDTICYIRARSRLAKLLSGPKDVIRDYFGLCLIFTKAFSFPCLGGLAKIQRTGDYGCTQTQTLRLTNLFRKVSQVCFVPCMVQPHSFRYVHSQRSKELSFHSRIRNGSGWFGTADWSSSAHDSLSCNTKTWNQIVVPGRQPVNSQNYYDWAESSSTTCLQDTSD